MKKFFFASAAIAACFLVSCKDEKAGSADNNAAVKEQSAAFMKSIETGDFSKTKDWLTADAVDHGSGANMSDVKGADSIVANLSRIHASFEPGYKSEVMNQSIDGDYLYAMIHMKGKTTANPGMGMPAATDIDMRSVEVTKLKDGKAAEHWSFASVEDMMKMAPPPQPAPAVQVDTAMKMSH